MSITFYFFKRIFYWQQWNCTQSLRNTCYMKIFLWETVGYNWNGHEWKLKDKLLLMTFTRVNTPAAAVDANKKRELLCIAFCRLLHLFINLPLKACANKSKKTFINGHRKTCGGLDSVVKWISPQGITRLKLKRTQQSE